MVQHEWQDETRQLAIALRLWLWWTLATTIAGAIVGALEASGFQFIATIFFTGLLIGAAQWLVLRQYIPKAFWWIVVSTLGWTLGLVLVAPNETFDPLIQFLSTLGAWPVFWTNLVTQPIVMAILGAAQFPILRRFVRKAHWWILVSAFGGALAGAGSSTVAYILHPGLLPAPFSTALAYGSGWLGYGIVTGICLQWLLRHQPRRAIQHKDDRTGTLTLCLPSILMSLEIKSMAVLKQFGILFVLGIAGIAMVTVTSVPLVERQLAKLSPEVLAKVPPLWILMLLQALQPTVLLAISILIGIGCAYRVGLRSHLIDYWVLHTPKIPFFVTELKWSLGVGAATTIIVLLLDRLMQPALPEALRAANTEPSWLNLLTAMLYGGITEEILMRWGLMSLLIWIAWKGLKQGVTLPSQGIYQGAIVLAALVFGLLHLPATAAIVPLTPVVIIRALLLNGIAGIGFGWLFWQYSLEAAMLAHISFHAFAFVLNGLLARLA